MFGELIVQNNQWSIPNVNNVEKICETGFHITFNNGFIVSVQWGFGNYCENRRNMNELTSKDAEIAVFAPAGGFVPLMDDGYVDDVAGWVTPDQVKDLMNIVATLGSDDVFTKDNPLKFRDNRKAVNK